MQHRNMMYWEGGHVALSDPKKPSHLFVTVSNGVVKGVLAQKKAGRYHPLKRLSCILHTSIGLSTPIQLGGGWRTVGCYRSRLFSLKKPDLILTIINHCGPAEGLSETVRKEICNEHNCITLTDLQIKCREDLQEEAIEGAWNLYIDGSSRAVSYTHLTLPTKA